MYPKHFLDYFREFERKDEVFVAMPFGGDAAERRWEEIFVPAIEAVDLEPDRVDNRDVGDSILTDILERVGRARLILGDVSDGGVTVVDESGVRRPNPNAVYELGIAHAARLETEVVVVRAEPEDDEEERVPFDLLHIRHHTFDPRDPEGAADKIAGLLADALREIDKTKDHLVDRTLRSLDEEAKNVLHEYLEAGQLFPLREVQYGGMDAQTRRGARHLLELGLFRAEYNPELPTAVYHITPLGRAVADRIGLEPR